MSAQRGVHRRPASRVNRAFSVVGVLAALAMIIGGLTLTAGTASAANGGGSSTTDCSGSQARTNQDCEKPDPCKDKKSAKSSDECKKPDPCKDTQQTTKKGAKSSDDCKPECPDPSTKKGAKSSDDCKPECPKGQVKEGETCVTPPAECPDGQIKQGETCLTPPAECPTGQVKQGDACVTPPTDVPSNPGTPDAGISGTSTVTSAVAPAVDSAATVAQEPPAQVAVPEAATVTPAKPTAKKPAASVPVPTAAVLPTSVNAGGGSTWPQDPRLAWLLLVLGVVGLLGSGARLAWDRRN